MFTIDTGELFRETYDMWRRVEERYGLHVEVADASSTESTPWSVEHCCSACKVAALGRALDGAEAWLTGIRREQSPTRAEAPKRVWDEVRGLWKFNPLADWREEDVWRYVLEHELPYHPSARPWLRLDRLRSVHQPGSGREGRWAGQARRSADCTCERRSPPARGRGNRELRGLPAARAGGRGRLRHP